SHQVPAETSDREEARRSLSGRAVRQGNGNARGHEGPEDVRTCSEEVSPESGVERRGGPCCSTCRRTTWPTGRTGRGPLVQTASLREGRFLPTASRQRKARRHGGEPDRRACQSV